MKLNRNKIIIRWLYTGLILVGIMVIIGGITRLTNSGLSMVEWRLFGGMIPPLSEVEWQEVFKKYQQFPEYQKINKGMSINEFKTIFLWEYIHRVFGRLIGIIFIIPFIFFWTRKWLNNLQKKQLLLLLLLGGLQGFLGWFMVKSGLVDVPAVSHYRLAIHLVAAFTIMCYIYWLILTFNKINRETNNLIHKISKWLIAGLIIQIIYGAFMAGLKAGYLTNHNNTILQKIFGYNIRNSDDFSLLTNSFDIQAFHRLFAWVIFIITLIVFRRTRKTALEKTGNIILGLTIIQIFLGVLTLISKVHLYLAITHQFIGIILLLSVIRLYYLSSGKSQ